MHTCSSSKLQYTKTKFGSPLNFVGNLEQSKYLPKNEIQKSSLTMQPPKAESGTD